MSWEAPNLLNLIFREPEVADSQVFNNFMGGFLASRDRAAKAKADSTPSEDSGNDDEEEGGASGDADSDPGGSNDKIYTDANGNRSGNGAGIAGLKQQILSQPAGGDTTLLGSGSGGGTGGAGSSPGIRDLAGTPAEDTSWLGGWMRSSLEGQQMAKNITAYQQAVTSTQMQRAQTVGDILNNQEKAKHIQDSAEDQQAIADALKGVDPHEVWNTPAPYLKTAEGRQGWAEMQTTSASTLMAKAKQEMQAKMIGEAAKLHGEGFDVLDAQGNPDPKKVQAAGAAKFERDRQLELDKSRAIGERQAANIAQRDQDQSTLWDKRLQAALDQIKAKGDIKSDQIDQHDGNVANRANQHDLAVAQRTADNIDKRGQWNMKLLTEKQKAVTDQAGKLLNQTFLTAFKNKLEQIRSSSALSDEEKAKQFDQTIEEYGLKGKLNFNTIYRNPGAAAAPSRTNDNDPLGVR